MIRSNCLNYAKWADICSPEGLAGAGEVGGPLQRELAFCVYHAEQPGSQVMGPLSHRDHEAWAWTLTCSPCGLLFLKSEPPSPSFLPGPRKRLEEARLNPSCLAAEAGKPVAELGFWSLASLCKGGFRASWV